MMRAARISWLAALGACNNFVPPPAEMPWLYGFRATAITGQPTESAARHAGERGGTAETAYGALELRGDLRGDNEAETVIVSYQLGVVVVDSHDRVIARRGPFETAGSADSIVAVAIGDAGLTGPVLAVASQAGGHRESTVTLSLLRLAEHGTFATAFEQPIETHAGDDTHAGTLVFAPGGLTYRAPETGTAVRFVFDPKRSQYVPQAAPPSLD
jgi:hypothetical protein